MKKLQLNKQAIAQLDEPGKIYGGMTTNATAECPATGKICTLIQYPTCMPPVPTKVD
jgi:hypothetical protein